MESFLQRMVLVFFTAIGMVLGAALVGSLAAALSGLPPLRTMIRLAQEMKIWAIAGAMGGTFAALEVLESGIFQGEIHALIKQLGYLLSAFAGAQAGHYLIFILAGGR